MSPPTDEELRRHSAAAEIIGQIGMALGIPLITWFVTR
jgi:hypothetical protein